MISQILPPWLRGVMFAALCGAVMSTFNSGLNSASTIFTIDLYKKFINKNTTPQKEVRVGRITTAVIVVIACLWSPVILLMGTGVFTYIQVFWGFISPGIVAAFLVGIWLKKAPPAAAKGAMLLGLPLYGFCRFGSAIWKIPGLDGFAPGVQGVVESFNSWAFLHHQGLVFVILAIYMLIVTAIKPLEKEVKMPEANVVDTTPHPGIYLGGCVIIALTVALYIIFW